MDTLLRRNFKSSREPGKAHVSLSDVHNGREEMFSNTLESSSRYLPSLLSTYQHTVKDLPFAGELFSLHYSRYFTHTETDVARAAPEIPYLGI
ncbi:TPA: hypothetical protein EYP70_08325 [Candidatus Bathyarchaeota archaeon]|nr:hypothetical protein [Candidatus Bathyarchaeota archaeon]